MKMKLFPLNYYLIKFWEFLFPTFSYCILFDGKQSEFLKFRHTFFFSFYLDFLKKSNLSDIIFIEMQKDYSK